MIAKRVVGLTIVGVEHRRWFNEHLQRMETTVERIRLSDGSVLKPWAFEAEDGPAATIDHYHGRRDTPEEGTQA